MRSNKLEYWQKLFADLILETISAFTKFGWRYFMISGKVCDREIVFICDGALMDFGGWPSRFAILILLRCIKKPLRSHFVPRVCKTKTQLTFCASIWSSTFRFVAKFDLICDGVQDKNRQSFKPLVSVLRYWFWWLQPGAVRHTVTVFRVGGCNCRLV